MSDVNFEKIIDKLKELTSSEISLKDLQKQLDLNDKEVMGLISILKSEGLNIVTVNRDDDIYFLNQGEKQYANDYSFSFKTDENNKMLFLVISDARLGSIFSQKSILNELYSHAYDMGVRNVILTGNLTEGLYKMSNNMIDTLVAKDTMSQAKYVIDNYPYIEGMTTYLITGKKDQTHLSEHKIDIAKKICDERDDMVYIGNSRCRVFIDRTEMLVINRKNRKTYTQSYRAQKMIDAMRSEDKPDILLYGGLLQSEQYTYRNVKILSIPSVCGTTWEMEDKEYSNTVGGWIVEIETTSKGLFKSLKTINNIYYNTVDNDYETAKTLKKVRN